ncbi:MAG TPA: YceI family protein [Rhizomicrobium sp.]|jgi:polyisoprenoid-binding protein YceI
MVSRLFPLAALCFSAAVLTTGALAADPAPMKLPHGQKDIAAADSGAYTMDKNHVAVLARVSHMGFSISVFRFGAAEATLDWDAKTPGKSKLSATVDTSSIETNVPGFAEELQGEKYLNAKAFPTATFVSTAFHQKDAAHGTVDGNFTLKGITKPMTFTVTLVGAGAGFAGGPTMGRLIGVHAEGAINPQDFNMGPFFAEPIVLTVDTEFDKPNAPAK